MNRIRSFVVAAQGADRRSDRFDSEWRPGTAGNDKARLEVRRWRRAWNEAWRRPAISRDDLLARAHLILDEKGAITEIMDDRELRRFALDVVTIVGRRVAA